MQDPRIATFTATSSAMDDAVMTADENCNRWLSKTFVIVKQMTTNTTALLCDDNVNLSSIYTYTITLLYEEVHP